MASLRSGPEMQLYGTHAFQLTMKEMPTGPRIRVLQILAVQPGRFKLYMSESIIAHLPMLPQPCPQESLDRGAGPQSKSSFILLLCYVLFLDVFGIETFRFLISPNALFCSIPTIGASGFFQQLMLLQVSCWNGSISWTDHSK